MEILEDGSIKGRTFSGDKYKGEYPSPKEGKETYQEYYERCKECNMKGFHLGDLSWSDYRTYCLGSIQGGGESVRRYIIGDVPEDYTWSSYDCNEY